MALKIDEDAEKNKVEGMSVEEAEDDFAKNQQKVIHLLLEQVLHVDTSIPRVLKGDFTELLASTFNKD